MKIAFVCFGFENIGVEYLSAVLKEKGHTTSLIFDPLLGGTYLFKSPFFKKKINFDKENIKKIVNDSSIDLLAFSAMSDTYSYACDIAREVKKQRNDLPIVFGGIHSTSVPDLVIAESFVDFVCVGEGEEALLDLVDSLAKQTDFRFIPNIWTKQNGQIYSNEPREIMDNLDRLPLPDKDLFNNEFKGFISDVYRINIGRGCKLDCSFCSNSLLKQIYKDKYFKRKRTVESVIEELMVAKEKYAVKHILIIDDWFTDDIVWLQEFTKQYQEKIGLSFACDLYPGVSNEKVVALLQEAGCTVVSLGIQTYSEDLRDNILHRYDTNQNIIKTLSLLRKTNIFTYADFIIGIPTQDENELLKIADFINNNRVDFVFSLWLRYYPRTPITKMAFAKGWLSSQQIKMIEGAKCNLSYFDKGLTYNKEAAKLASFFSLIPLLPKQIVNYLLVRKLYACLPTSSFFYFRIMSFVVDVYKYLFRRKNSLFYFSKKESFLFSIHYLWKSLRG